MDAHKDDDGDEVSDGRRLSPVPGFPGEMKFLVLNPRPS